MHWYSTRKWATTFIIFFEIRAFDRIPIVWLRTEYRETAEIERGQSRMGLWMFWFMLSCEE